MRGSCGDPSHLLAPGEEVRGGAATASSCVCVKMVEEESVRVVRCGGSELNFRRAVFSADSKYGATALCERAEGASSGGGAETCQVSRSPAAEPGSRQGRACGGPRGTRVGAGACVP